MSVVILAKVVENARPKELGNITNTPASILMRSREQDQVVAKYKIDHP